MEKEKTAGVLGSGAKRPTATRIKENLSHIDNFVFDLDNTLYPRTCDLFAQVDVLITKYVVSITGFEHEKARRLQKDYYRDHGTTMNGLMIDYGIDPDHYLNNVHEIDYSIVKQDKQLVEKITSLKGRKFIFTNADIGHATAVLEQLGFGDIFDGMFDIRMSGFNPKPKAIAYDKFVNNFEIETNKAIMFDDLEKNLKVASQIGMQTVHVVPNDDFTHEHVENWELGRADDADHVHHITNDLAQFIDKFLT